MSTSSQNIAPLLVAERASHTNGNGSGAVAVAEKPKRPRSRPYKARVATKIRWALRDLMDTSTLSAEPTMRRLLEWAAQTRVLEEAVGDTARLARLGKLDHELASLALDVTKMVTIVTRALAESEPDDGQRTRGGTGQ